MFIKLFKIRNHRKVSDLIMKCLRLMLEVICYIRLNSF